MKKKLLLSVFVLPLVVINVVAQTNVLHLNLGSHNETNDAMYGVNYNTNYAVIKAKAMEVADSVNANGAKWDMQVESNFIRACITQDFAATSSTDLMQSMDNLSYVEVDPHNHLDTVPGLNYNPYNYADLSHLLDSCGLSTRTNVGGFLYQASEWDNADGNWLLWKSGLKGRTFPWITWTPVVLWGGGTKAHISDPLPVGVWHPGGATAGTFMTNNSAELLDMGNGCSWLVTDSTDVTALLAEINDYIFAINFNPASTNTFYSSTIMFNFRNILATNTVSKVAEVLRGIKPLVANNSVVWETLSEKRADWLTTHNNTTDNFIKICSDLNVGINDPIVETTAFVVYPNPANDQLTITFNDTEKKDIQLFDITGKLIFSNLNSDAIEKTIDISQLPSSIYFLKVETAKGSYSKKIVVNH